MGQAQAKKIAQAMALRIQHRGPDAAREWADDDGAVALAHRRLSIVDLSEAGSQPMRSASGRFELVYNGEIYNHAQLRAELPAQSWRGHSDTETLLAAIEHWGFEAALKRAVGMFAIALWDRKSRRLALARDRMGEKPLYFGVTDGSLVFGSELKALRSFPGYAPTVDPGAAALMLRHCYIPAPHTIYRGTFKLPPATIAEFAAPDRPPSITTYWSLREVIERGRREPFEGSDAEAVDAVERHIDNAITLQREADVPLGAFLSGGIDSSTIVALMQKQGRGKVRTFTIGFDEPRFNEADHAKAVAAHLGTDHTEMMVTGRDALDLVPRLPELYCEPFSDSSQLPTILVSRIARQHVTVALSGDAGDELYGGYTRYDVFGRAWSRQQARSRGVRRAGAAMWGSLPRAAWRGLGSVIGRPRLDDQARKQAQLLAIEDAATYYRYQTARNPHPEDLLLEAQEPPTALTTPAGWPAFNEFDEQMMYLDQVSYLPDDILCKVDRAAMSTSLETRVPLLDHRVVEHAWTLPLRFKRRQGVGKWVLRQLLDRHVPRALIDRPKAGFAVPLTEWLTGPLRPWAEDLLAPQRIAETGLLNVAAVRRLWEDQLSGRSVRSAQVWDVLVLQAWLVAQRADP